MKIFWTAIALLAVGSTTTFAQVNHRLEFYADEALTSCELAMTTPGLVKVHMVVTGTGNFISIAFKAPKPACMTNATWLGDVWQVPGMLGYFGNTQGTNPDIEGVGVVFTCSPLPRYLGSIWYNVAGPALPCCQYGPQPQLVSPFPGYIETILLPTCNIEDQMEVPAAGKGLVVNPNETCRCDLPLSTQQSTWGAVKALYR